MTTSLAEVLQSCLDRAPIVPTNDLMARQTQHSDESSNLSERACRILKLVVEQYIHSGHPVGSRTLSELGQLDVSPATIRNALSDLERLGFLSAPHTSAGRVPTAQGYRYFVDALLSPQEPEVGEALALKHQLLTRLQAGEEAASTASQLLSQLSQQAAVVSVPRQNQCRLQQLEFVPLGERRVLAVLIVNGNQVQNRIFELPEPVRPNRLVEAANFLNQNYAGKDLLALRDVLSREVSEGWDEINRVMRQVAEFAEQVVNPGERNKLAVSGRANLLAAEELLDPQYLKSLFDALDRKRDMLSLMDRCLDAQGIRIFIGQESGYDVLGNCSLITAPYHVGGEMAGVLGVIGPQRMDYGKVIPLVDNTAKALGGALDQGQTLE